MANRTRATYPGPWGAIALDASTGGSTALPRGEPLLAAAMLRGAYFF